MGTAYSDMLDLGHWTTDNLFSDSRLTTNSSVMHVGGDDISSEFIGDLHGVNNIEAPDAWQLYEFWSGIRFGGRGNTSLRLGRARSQRGFRHAGHTQRCSSGQLMALAPRSPRPAAMGPPFFPSPALAFASRDSVNEYLRWRFGAFEGTPGDDDEASFAGSSSRRRRGQPVHRRDGIRERSRQQDFTGLWSYTRGLRSTGRRSNYRAAIATWQPGRYALLDLPLATFGSARVDGSLRVGLADARFNAVDQYAGATVVVSHPFAGKPDDAFGFAAAYGQTGDVYRAVQDFAGVPATSGETSFELTYRSTLTSWLALAPSVQFVRNPGADLVTRDAWVVGLRFELARGKVLADVAQRAGSPRAIGRKS